MTDRIHALTVILQIDTREDDIQPLVDAIKLLRNVADVNLHVANIIDYSARTRIRRELLDKLWKVLDD